jgi:hypothetical protein
MRFVAECAAGDAIISACRCACLDRLDADSLRDALRRAGVQCSDESKVTALLRTVAERQAVHVLLQADPTLTERLLHLRAAVTYGATMVVLDPDGT